MELTYRAEGDYLLPNLTVPESPMLGKYGMLRRSFLREQKKGLYTGMLLSGKLNGHLEQIDRQASEMMEHLTSQMAMKQGVNESLKASNQMRWVQMMNNIRSAAEETVLSELIYS
ncbi:MAG: TnpV protein [Clostridiales bacterium]|nr:TnpV protein [Clostridiales bacterium]